MHALARKDPPAPLRVLLVDDNEDEFALLEATARRIGRNDVVCSWTPDPEIAIAQVGAGDAELVLLDYRLGDASGLDVLRRLSQLGARCPTILLTQGVVAQVAEEGARLGAHAVYDKAVMDATLLGRIVESIRKAPSRRVQPANEGPEAATAWSELVGRAMSVAGLGAIGVDGDRIVAIDARACTLLRAPREALVGSDLWGRLSPVHVGAERPDNWYLVEPTDPSSAVEVVRDGGVVSIRDAAADYERSLLLEATWRETEAFAYGASHDLQAPLRKIVMFTEAIARTHDLGDHAADCARRAVRSAQHMSGLIDALLQYSRAGNRQRPLTIESIDLECAVREALDACAGLRQRADAVTHVSVSGTALADRGALRKVLDEVVSNAARFVESGDSPRVEVTCERDGRGVHLIVSDDGVGLDMDHAERIFAPFERLWGRSQYPGHGLGLSTARRWLARMGGEITIVRAADNDGATFRITLPA